MRQLIETIEKALIENQESIQWRKAIVENPDESDEIRLLYNRQIIELTKHEQALNELIIEVNNN